MIKCLKSSLFITENSSGMFNMPQYTITKTYHPCFCEWTANTQNAKITNKETMVFS